METTDLNLGRNLAAMLDQVVNDREVLFVYHRGARTVAIVPADELTGLMETARMVRAPKNARRLLKTLRKMSKDNP
jgi:antitoxin YefM